MSYEGYSQLICPLGHYWEEDASAAHQEAEPVCPDCKEGPLWVNNVDDTNCDGFGRILMEHLLLVPHVEQKCSLGHTHITTPAVYRIPSDTEREALRMYRVEDERGVGSWRPINAPK